MATEEAAKEFKSKKFIIITAIAIISEIWGFIQPGKFAETININLGLISIPAPVAILIGLFISVIFLGLGFLTEWQIKLGLDITIQSKHLLVIGTILVLFTSFTFIGLDILGFFIYYYEIILILSYSLISLYGISSNISIFNFSFPLALNVPSIILLFLGIIFGLAGLILVIKNSDWRFIKWTIPRSQSSNFLILGVVLLLSTIFVASLFQPTYVKKPGTTTNHFTWESLTVIEGNITWKNWGYEPTYEGENTSAQRVANDSILLTIQGLPLGSSLVGALSDFYLDFVIYIYPLVIFICGILLLRYSFKKPSQPEPFISDTLKESLEGLPRILKRLTKLISLFLGISIVILFLLLAIGWIANIELDGIYDLEVTLFQHGVGLFILSLLIAIAIYIPKAIQPFLDERVLRYTARRFLAIVPMFVGISIISYGLMMATGSPVNLIMSRLSPGPGRDVVYRDLIRIYGLNAPPQSQWFNWFIHFIMGDLGNSIHGGWAVVDAIGVRIGPTLEISILPLILTIIISIPLGIYAGLRQYSWEDNTISIFVAAGLAMPIFLMIILFILAFGYYIPILPPGGMTTSWLNAQNVNLLYVYLYKDTFIRDLFSWEFWDLTFHLIIPISAITIISLALYTRLVRSGYLEVIRQDFILSAQAYGFDERTIIFRHSLKNVMIPLVTYIGLSIGGLLGGAPITETTLGWPGLGRYAVTSIQAYDYPIVMGLIMVTALLILLANLLTDLLYSVIDPRVAL
ncbi:MAG: ABC transporter permease [Promethearchaeota archaeon]